MDGTDFTFVSVLREIISELREINRKLDILVMPKQAQSYTVAIGQVIGEGEDNERS
jgi:hypothetical protein